MKETYKQPTVTVLMIKSRTTVLTGTFGDGIWGTGIDDTPGSQEDFG